MKTFGGVAILLFVANLTFAQDVNRPSQPDLPGDLMIDYGFNIWSPQVDELPVRAWGSNSLGIYYNKRFEISSRISFYGAGGFTFERVAFENDLTWVRDANGAVSLDTIGGIFMRKNKLVSTYLEVPVEFRIHPLKTVAGEGWFIGIGAIAGLRIGNHTKIKYDFGDETRKEKLYGDLGLENFRYGLQLRFGFRSFHLFYKTYLNDAFSSPPTGGNNPRMSTFGINFSGF
ncbi:MAG: outer membrane beta-barrel protein [Cyclobacteriaceae bacterium]